eukprot:Clim_evm6s224 gene=Clim_evmTU6s224
MTGSSMTTTVPSGVEQRFTVSPRKGVRKARSVCDFASESPRSTTESHASLKQSPLSYGHRHISNSIPKMWYTQRLKPDDHSSPRQELSDADHMNGTSQLTTPLKTAGKASLGKVPTVKIEDVQTRTQAGTKVPVVEKPKQTSVLSGLLVFVLDLFGSIVFVWTNGTMLIPQARDSVNLYQRLCAVTDCQWQTAFSGATLREPFFAVRAMLIVVGLSVAGALAAFIHRCSLTTIMTFVALCYVWRDLLAYGELIVTDLEATERTVALRAVPNSMQTMLASLCDKICGYPDT